MNSLAEHRKRKLEKEEIERGEKKRRSETRIKNGSLTMTRGAGTTTSARGGKLKHNKTNPSHSQATAIDYSLT